MHNCICAYAYAYVDMYIWTPFRECQQAVTGSGLSREDLGQLQNPSSVHILYMYTCTYVYLHISICRYVCIYTLWRVAAMQYG